MDTSPEISLIGAYLSKIPMKKLFQYIGAFAFIFLIYFLGEMSGILEGNLLGEFLSKNVAPYKKTVEPHRYYFLLSLTSTWILIFCIINLKFSSKASSILTARLGRCGVVSILCMLLYFVIWPGIADRRFPLSYSEWPVDFSSFLYQEDGLLETLTAVLLLLASIQFFLAGKYATKHLLFRRTILALFLLSILSMIFMMEEISWGQRIFSWENPEIIQNFNYQQETNFHNLFNPIIGDMERIIALFISLTLLTAILFRDRITSPAIRGLFPSDKYYYIPILFFIAGMMSSELFEEVFAVFLFFYSKDIWDYYSNRDFPYEHKNS